MTKEVIENIFAERGLGQNIPIQAIIINHDQKQIWIYETKGW